jgi:hypothetical protein
MRVIAASMVVGLATFFLAHTNGAQDQGQNGKVQPPFAVPGLFSIASPDNGFVWESVTTKEFQGTKAYYFHCKKPGSNTHMLLVVEDRNPDSEGKKSAATKAHWNVMCELVANMKLKEAKGARPSIEAPIPEVLQYGITAETDDGIPTFVQCASIFKTRIYSLTVIGNNLKEAQDLREVSKTIKELKND